MDFTGQHKIELFANNVLDIKKEFVWQNTQTKRMAALLYAQAGKAVDCEAISRCHSIIKENTGMFSTFRGNMSLCLAALLSLSADPQRVFGETLKVYDLLKGAKLRASDFLAIAAWQIAVRSNSAEYDNVAARTRGFYDGMKERHFFYTGQDDYIFAAMLALTDLDLTTGTERIEQLYVRLKDDFWDRNSVQTLAQVLVLGNSEDSASVRVLALRDALRTRKIKLDRTYTLPLLGILALLPAETDTIVRDLDAAQAALKEKKGLGAFSINTQERLMFAASIIAGEYAENLTDGVLTAVLSTGVANIIIAQQCAMIAAICASSAAAISSSSSSST